MTILTQLILMVLLALAPTVAAHGINDFIRYHERAESVREATLRTVELRNTQLDQIVIGVERILSAVSRIPSVASMDEASCEERLKELLTVTPTDLVLAVVTPQGGIVCSSAERSRPIYNGDREFFSTTISTGSFTVGDYVQARVDNRPSLSFGLPIRENGHVVGVVAGLLHTDWITAELRRSRLLQGESLLITDQKGVVIAHLPEDTGNWIGRTLPSEYLEPIKAATAGTFEAKDLQGHSAIFSYVPITVPPPNIYLLASVEKDAAFAALRAAAWRSSVLSALSLGLAAVIAWLIATVYIRRPVDHLLLASKRWREGEYSVRAEVSRSCRELNKLAGEFNSMAEAVELRNRRLDAANRAKELVIATAGHDLRQPLQILTTAIARLHKQPRSDGEQRYSEAAQFAVKKLNEGLDALVEATRIHRKALQAPHQSFDITEILHEIEMDWSERASRKGLRLRIRRCDSAVMSNKEMLTTVLQNLVGNAIKYTQTGGVLVCCRRRTHELWLEVYDTGPGIPKESLGSIFEQFQQADPAQEGFGLGLWIVRNTIQALGHGLTVASVLGKGSRFRLIVPLFKTSGACMLAAVENGGSRDQYRLVQQNLGEARSV
jgi:signal transduction histidine kinase